MSMRTKIPVVIPARNEANRILDTIDGIRKIGREANIEMFLVVVDDGSSDITAAVSEKAGCHVIRLKDRGYSALGKPELADTHNAGFDFISSMGIDFEFVMVVGSDTTFKPDYLKLLLAEMDADSNLVMCAGMIDGLRTNPTAVRGSGRIIRYSYWKTIGERLPNCYYGWESYPVVYANAHGYKTKTVYDALMFTSRAPLHGVRLVSLWNCNERKRQYFPLCFITWNESCKKHFVKTRNPFGTRVFFESSEQISR